MFYCYNQNNSGGSFVSNDSVAHYVFIEADSANEADDRAEDIGIYFNGVKNYRDCECCGDRWYEARYNDATIEPMIYGTPVASFTDTFSQEGKPYAYYKDGRKESFQ